MRAVVIHEHGGPEVLRFEDRPVPEPGPRQVRVRVRAVGLNHLDLWVRNGVPGHTFPLPIVPGCDIAGVVEALGPGAVGVGLGDEVVVVPGFSCGRCGMCRAGDDALCGEYGILGESCDGGCQECIVVPDLAVFAKPEGLDWVEAAAIPLTFLTAWHMLKSRARVQPGEHVLIHAAGSGVSVAAIQIAKLLGGRVLTTAGSDEKCRRALVLGADEAVNYRSADFVKEARRFGEGRGVEVVVDHVGADTFQRSLRCLVKGGRYVTCGATSGYELKTDFRLVFFKSLSILGSTMGGSHELATVLQLVAAGHLRPVVDRVYDLAEIADAHGRLTGREAFGKVVLAV